LRSLNGKSKMFIQLKSCLYLLLVLLGVLNLFNCPANLDIAKRIISYEVDPHAGDLKFYWKNEEGVI